MCRNSHPRANFCKCLVGQSPIKERNSHLPFYIQSESTGPTRASPRHLRDTYPVLFNDLRESGNRVLNPIHRLSPFFKSIHDQENCEEAMKLIVSTLRHRSCQYPPCPDFAYDPVLDSWRERLQFATRLGDPVIYEDELQRYLGLFEVFNALQGPRGRNDFPTPRLYPHLHGREVGLGPGLDPLIRKMCLRFLPSIAWGGPEGVFKHILNHHNATGNDTTMVRRLIEDLRIDEQAELYEFAYLLAISTGNMLAHKIVKILDGELADQREILEWLLHRGLLRI